jgi:DNA-directed RNA polymerase specialized sigma24 family protein
MSRAGPSTGSPVDVVAHRWEHGWELHVTDDRGPVAVLPVRRLSGAERTVRDYLACAGGVDPAAMRVRISVRFGNGLDDEIAAVRADLEQVVRAQREAAVRSRRLALLLREEGLSGADIAVVLRVSPQRVSQLVRG